ncbi:glutaredoxin family protein [Aeromicrobium sp. REDSEA-S38_B2]|jgi:glutaredoxin|uniref:glutaredoxin family protein n=2 Tax=unclassified Aeromicrobium TaxID=2633570 RepID=UPI000B292C7F
MSLFRRRAGASDDVPSAPGSAGHAPAVPHAHDARVVVYSRAGCHLCEAAEAEVERVCAEQGSDWARVDVDTDPELVRLFHAMVPVVFVDGRQHDFFRVTPARLVAALDRPAR